MGFVPLPPPPVKARKVSHTIYICTLNKKKTIEHIYAAIVGLGVTLATADSNNSLAADDENSKTTIVAIIVTNFNTELSNSDILDRIADAISDYDYFGLIVRSSKGGSTWRAGNVYHEEFDRVLAKVKPSRSEEPKPEPEPGTESSKKEPEPEVQSKTRIDLQLLTKVVRSSCKISDVFFDDCTQEDRRLLARELEKLCQNPDATIEDIVPKE